MKFSSCARHAHAPGSTCLGFPEESRAGPGRGKISAPAASQGRKAPFHGGVSAAGGGESQRKSREREGGSGPSVRRAGLEAGPELNHAVEELHGSHDVLVLSGAGGKQESWAQNSNLGSSPKPGFTLMAALACRTRAPGITSSFQALLRSMALLICMRMRHGYSS